MRAPAQIVFSCEHGGNQIPVECAAQFSTPRAQQWLRSHRGWDPGALEAAQSLATQAGQPLIASTITRMAVDLNRSLDHPNVHSEIVSQMSQRQRNRLIRKYYAPYRNQLAQRLHHTVQSEHFVLHLSIHTFTPRFRGVLREFEIGLLFDPARTNEAWICSRWQQHMTQLSPRLRVELNRPYLGIDDGLTTAMRARFTDDQYAGIELEINSRLRRRTSAGRQRLWQTLYKTLKMTLTELPVKTS